MTVLRPDYLWLLALLPLAAFGLYRRRRRRQRLATLMSLPRRPGQTCRDGCFLAGLGLVMLAAAGPGIGQGPAAGPETPGRLVVALDCSKSMWARDVAPNRLEAAKALLRTVLAGLPEVPTGLVLFAGRARLVCPVTRDRAGVRLFLDAASPAALDVGGTNLVAALEAGRLALAGGGPGVVLLVSDGEATVAAADAARKGGPPVCCVAVGGASPVTVPDSRGGLIHAGERPVLVGTDMAGLTALAAASGGCAFPLSPDAPSPAQALIKALGQRLASRTAEHQAGSRPADRTIPCLGLGLLLLAGGLFDGRRRHPATLVLGLLCLTWPAAPARAESAETAVTQGIRALAEGRYEAARDRFLAARVRRPDAPVILFDLGTAYYRLGAFDRALQAFDRAARTATGALRGQALYNQGNAAYRLGRADQARSLYQAALALLPQDADVRANLDFLRTRPRRPATATGRPDQPPSSGGPPATAETGQTTRPGQAPASQGHDAGTGREDAAPNAPQPPMAGPAGSSGQDATAAVPLAAAQGMAGGIRRARPDDRPGEPLLWKVPDLPGLPLPTPVYGRPNVEKDW